MYKNCTSLSTVESNKFDSVENGNTHFLLLYIAKARWLSWLERRPVTAEVMGSNPIRVVLQLNIPRDLSSAGRASALQAEGHRFEPCRSHHLCRLGSMAEQLICNQQVVGSTPTVG